MEKFIESTKTYRYECMGKHEHATTVLYVLHGYGQLARDFIQQFSFLQDDVLLIAPEGMHRFYLKGTSGPIGASWMTKEARDQDINDTLEYLKRLKGQIDLENPGCKSYLLGFSQGGSSAMRWHAKDAGFEQVFIWCSSCPPDISFPPSSAKQGLYFLGSQDHYFTEESRIKSLEAYKKLGFRTIEFEGGHQIDQVILKDILLHLHH